MVSTFIIRPHPHYWWKFDSILGDDHHVTLYALVIFETVWTLFYFEFN